MIHHGDCLEVLKSLPDSSCDSLVTDPPAGISFMGKSWDDDKGGRKQWIAWMSEVMSECMRVMKPGAHGLVWAIPRTSHWTATALEDAGFEIRDVITHHFGSGFPKSLDISKAIDKAAGAEREVVAIKRKTPSYKNDETNTDSANWDYGSSKLTYDAPISAPATDLAKEWQGWGTALKPASEHWILVRKPISEKTVAKNVEKWGVGGINIDGCRIGTETRTYSINGAVSSADYFASAGTQPASERDHKTVSGRFPANLVLSCVCDEDQHDAFCPVHVLDEQSGNLKSGARKEYPEPKYKNRVFGGGMGGNSGCVASEGGASRFFYVAKPSKRERNAGCESLPVKQAKGGGGGVGNYLDDVDSASGKFGSEKAPAQNHHPTVKPIKLMRYLIRMITPKGGVVLDPFTGSGTTGVAAIEEGMKFLGIEREPEYTQIAEKRIYHAIPKFKKQVHGPRTD